MVRIENLGQAPVNLPDKSGGHGKVRPVNPVEEANRTRKPADEHASHDHGQDKGGNIQRNEFGDTAELHTEDTSTEDSPETKQS
jgi:hypothetical protein